jgi:hypothetical protein
LFTSSKKAEVTLKPRHLARSGLRAIGAGLVVASLLLPTAAFAADPVATNPQQAVSLSRKLTGHLDAGTGGHFAFYKFVYPADGSTATINAHFTPDDPVVLQNAGMKIYDPTGKELVDGGRQPKSYPNVSGNVIIDDRNRAGTYVVQLYNYDPGAAFDFEIWSTGLPPQPEAGQTTAAPAPSTGPTLGPGPAIVPGPGPAVVAPAPGPAVAPAPAATDNSQPQGAIQLQPDKIVNGGLEGNSGGRFAYYKFTYKGDMSTVTINLQIEPDDALILENSGFRIYGPTPGKEYAKGGAQKGLVPNVAGNLISNEAGEYVVQVYNYNPQAAIGFALVATGLTEQPQTAAAPAAPAPAAPTPVASAPAPAASATPGTGALSQQQNTFKGHLAAGTGGHFALYEFNYPGNREVYTLNMQVYPDTEAGLRNSGFKVYGPVKDKVYVESGSQQGLTPNVTANLISLDPGTYTVQVYNYNPEVAIDYELSLVAGTRPGEDINKTQ